MTDPYNMENVKQFSDGFIHDQNQQIHDAVRVAEVGLLFGFLGKLFSNYRHGRSLRDTRNEIMDWTPGQGGGATVGRPGSFGTPGRSVHRTIILRPIQMFWLLMIVAVIAFFVGLAS